MPDMMAALAAVIVCPSTDAASDATWVASLLSLHSPLRARDFARAMAERSAWDIELHRHDHWRRVAALLADHAPMRVRAPVALPGSTGRIAVTYQRSAHPGAVSQ